MNCRTCDSAHLTPFLDLGHHPPSNAFLTSEGLKQPETYYPLDVLVCEDCGLSQLSYVVPARILFGPDYPYDSSTSRTIRDHFNAMATHLTEYLGPAEESLAVDIGSNTGVLLGGLKAQGLRVLGVEPADNMATKANNLGIETINAFFSRQLAADVVSSHGQASVVTATNVFAHIDDLVDVVDGVRLLLEPQGAFVVEAQYFLDMVSATEYDQIYHEHLSYMTVSPLVRFFERRGLEVFDVEHVSNHGGSIRVFVGLPGRHPISNAVGASCQQEQDAGVLRSEGLRRFALKVEQSRDALVERLVTLKAQGKRTVGIGAPAKGNTLLNYCKISSHLLDELTEKAPDKIGLFSPGMHIPVVAESRLTEAPPDYGVILAWNLKDEIMANIAESQNFRGPYIIPIPEPIVV